MSNTHFRVKELERKANIIEKPRKIVVLLESENLTSETGKDVIRVVSENARELTNKILQGANTELTEPWKYSPND